MLSIMACIMQPTATNQHTPSSTGRALLSSPQEQHRERYRGRDHEDDDRHRLDEPELLSVGRRTGQKTCPTDGVVAAVEGVAQAP